MGERRRALLARALADELDHARQLLETLAIQLCLDEMVFERHADALQQFDRVGQWMGEIGTVLRHGGGPAGAVAQVRLDVMRDRLEKAASTVPA